MVTMTRNRTVTAVFSEVPPATTASQSAGPSTTPGTNPCKCVPKCGDDYDTRKREVPEASPFSTQGGFSLYWLFLIIGLPLFALMIIFFVAWKKRNAEEGTNI